MIIIDQIGIFYIFPLLIRCACIYSVCSFTSNLVYAYKLENSNYLIRRMLDNGRHVSRRMSIGQATASSVVGTFERVYAEHTRICAHVLYGDQKIWSMMMFSFLTTNVPANVYFITHLLFDQLPIFEQLFYSVIMLIQLVAAVFILLRLAKNSKLIHQFDRYIPAIQQMLTGHQYLHCKLKFDQLMHRLTTGKYGMTVGPVFLVTYESVVKVRLD